MTTCGFTVLSGEAECAEYNLKNCRDMVRQENLTIFVHLG
jgi:hypothetical protein